VILSLFVTPLLLRAGPHIAAGMSRATVLTRLLGVRSAVEASEEGQPLKDHVIIAGYGITGQELSRSLREEGIPYLVVDLNPENVRRALADGEPAVFGDVTSPEVQEHIGAARARRLVLVINDADAARRAVDAVARTAPELPVLVRTHYVIDVPFLLAAGADTVVPAELEAAAEVTSQVLRERGVDAARIESHIARIRTRRED